MVGVTDSSNFPLSYLREIQAHMHGLIRKYQIFTGLKPCTETLISFKNLEILYPNDKKRKQNSSNQVWHERQTFQQDVDGKHEQ